MGGSILYYTGLLKVITQGRGLKWVSDTSLPLHRLTGDQLASK